MLLNPGVLALLSSSALLAALAVVAAGAGLSVLAGWNPHIPDERQLARERRLFLVETVARVILGVELAGLFLFVALAERLHPLLTGAMCATGTLRAGPLGFPTLFARLAVFLLAGLWWVVQGASPHATGVGLVRFKVLFLLLVSAGLMVENGLQLGYFASLQPAVLTSCCATVFAPGAPGLAGEVAALPAPASRLAFFSTLGLTLAVGGRTLGRRRSHRLPLAPGLFGLLTALFGVVSLVALVAWVAPAWVQLPHHHCPFCLLGGALGTVGYFLYLALAVGVVTGMGCGLVAALRPLAMAGEIPAGAERRLSAISLGAFLCFTALALGPIALSAYRVVGLIQGGG